MAYRLCRISYSGTPCSADSTCARTVSLVRCTCTACNRRPAPDGTPTADKAVPVARPTACHPPGGRRREPVRTRWTDTGRGPQPALHRPSAYSAALTAAGASRHGSSSSGACRCFGTVQTRRNDEFVYAIIVFHGYKKMFKKRKKNTGTVVRNGLIRVDNGISCGRCGVRGQYERVYSTRPCRSRARMRVSVDVDTRSRRSYADQHTQHNVHLPRSQW